MTLGVGCTAEDNFPIILQENYIECGPVCLKMVASFYGKEVELKEIARMSGMDSIKGTSLLGLSQAADSMGYKNLAVRIPYSSLAKEAP